MEKGIQNVSPAYNSVQVQYCQRVQLYARLLEFYKTGFETIFQILYENHVSKPHCISSERYSDFKSCSLS